MSRIHGVVHAHRNDALRQNRSFLDSVNIPSLCLVYQSKEVLEHMGRDKGLSTEAYSLLLEAYIRISLFTQI